MKTIAMMMVLSGVSGQQAPQVAGVFQTGYYVMGSTTIIPLDGNGDLDTKAGKPTKVYLLTPVHAYAFHGTPIPPNLIVAQGPLPNSMTLNSQWPGGKSIGIGTEWFMTSPGITGASPNYYLVWPVKGIPAP